MTEKEQKRRATIAKNKAEAARQQAINNARTPEQKERDRINYEEHLKEIANTMNIICGPGKWKTINPDDD